MKFVLIAFGLARLATKPSPIGSETCTKTIGTESVMRWSAANAMPRRQPRLIAKPAFSRSKCRNHDALAPLTIQLAGARDGSRHLRACAAHP
jgi:hypothetical protein